MSPCLTLKVCMPSVACPLNPMSPEPHVPMPPKPHVPMSNPTCVPMSPKPHVPMSNPKGVYVFCTMPTKPHVPWPHVMSNLKVCMSSVPCPLNPMSPEPHVPMSPKPHVPMKGVYVFCTMSPKPHVPFPTHVPFHHPLNPMSPCDGCPHV